MTDVWTSLNIFLQNREDKGMLYKKPPNQLNALCVIHIELVKILRQTYAHYHYQYHYHYY